MATDKNDKHVVDLNSRELEAILAGLDRESQYLWGYRQDERDEEEYKQLDNLIDRLRELISPEML